RNGAPFAPEQTLGEALLTPTRIYVKPLLKAIRETRAVKALAHITGGGFLENIPRVLPPDTVAEVDVWMVPAQPVFAWIRQSGNVSEREMLRTFNCGIGMIVVASAGGAQAVRQSLEHAGESVVELGAIAARRGPEEQVKPKGRLPFP